MLNLIQVFLKRALPLTLCLGLSLNIGCHSGKEGPTVYPVTGTVTLDGAPLPTGTILLQDPTRIEKTYIATIKDGAVSGESTAGQKNVVITAIRQSQTEMVPGADGTGMEPATEQYLPEKYNTRTTLTTEIQKGNDNVLNFDLSSQ